MMYIHIRIKKHKDQFQLTDETQLKHIKKNVKI